MQIKSIRLNGLEGIPHDPEQGITLTPLGQFNILIGPNNAGKSSIIRFLMKFSMWMKSGDWSVASHLGAVDCWKYDVGCSAEIVIVHC